MRRLAGCGNIDYLVAVLFRVNWVLMSAVSLVWAGITHGWFVKCAVCWCRMINGKKTAFMETQTSMGASMHQQTPILEPDPYPDSDRDP